MGTRSLVPMAECSALLLFRPCRLLAGLALPRQKTPLSARGVAGDANLAAVEEQVSGLHAREADAEQLFHRHAHGFGDLVGAVPVRKLERKERAQQPVAAAFGHELLHG